MKIIQTSDVNSDEFQQAMKIYNTSFPANETRSVPDTIKLFKKFDFKLFISMNRDVTGFAMVGFFEGFAHLDYMAIRPDCQGMGIGSKMIQEMENFLKHTDAKLLTMEIQKETTQQDIDRLRFYNRLGVKKILDNYLLPPYSGDVVEEMYLMGLQLSEM